MAERESNNIGTEGNESKVCTTKCIIITVSVITLVAVLVGVIVAVVLLVPSHDGNLMSSTSLSRRTLNRFRRNYEENKLCWDRSLDKDSFYSVIDTHNHFRPFGGPSVEFETYLQWMQDAGILFSTMMGIGQLIKRKNLDDPECCYYLHCPTFNFTVVPDPTNDRINAQNYKKYKNDVDLQSKLHLTLSATFPNLQSPGRIMTNLRELEQEFPHAFGWAGEINVIKHALVGNGFFKAPESPRITKRFLDQGNLDNFFQYMEQEQWPVTIHCDCGCDNYKSIPRGAFEHNPIKDCDVPQDELNDARRHSRFWKDVLGPFYPAFFYTEFHNKDLKQNAGMPNKAIFRKVQHLQLMDTILSRYPNMKVVWAHMCLNKELLSLHPRVHAYIMERFFKKYPNLYVDISWDVLAKLLLLNYDEMEHDIDDLSTTHMDIHTELEIWNRTHTAEVEKIRDALHKKWDEGHEDAVHATGSHKTLTGPTYAFVVYLELFSAYSDRFVTGTDFVSSMGDPSEYPGLKSFKDPPSGCLKDKANHKRQVTDTSSVNIFFNDETFRKIVLGENFFKLTGLDKEFAAPQMCTPVTAHTDTMDTSSHE